MVESSSDTSSDDFSFAKQKLPRRFTRRQKTWRSDDSGSASTAETKINALVKDISAEKLPTNKYKFQPITDEQIRLLILHPGKEDDNIKCSIGTFLYDGPDEELPKYHALSYYWGEDDPVYPIRLWNISTREEDQKAKVRPSDNPKRRLQTAAKHARYSFLGDEFHVRKNLLDALKYLRQSDKDVTLWIDALCIDQSNIPERNAQVRRMKSLYNRARAVCIWLGKGNSATQRIMCKNGFIERMSDPSQLDKIFEATGNSKDEGQLLQSWVDLAALMQSRWFSRRWVVQELAMARKATVHCGHEFQLWPVFRDAVASLNLKWPQIQKQDYYRRLRQGQEVVGEVGALGASVIVDVISNLFTMTDNEEILERLTSLETLVSTLQSFEAGKPRDLIYALLSVASDPPPNVPPLEVDYKKATLDVFSEFLELSFISSDSLDMICRHWAMQPTKGGDKDVPRYNRNFRKKNLVHIPLPSYMSLASGASFGSGQHVSSGRRNGESFVGRPDRRNYKASKKEKPVFELPKFEGDEYERRYNLKDGKYAVTEDENIMPPRYQGVLKVKGFRLSPIVDVVGPIAEGTITKDCLSLAGWRTDDHAEDQTEDMPPKLWRTLVANRDSKGGPVSSLYESACGYCLANVGPNGHVNTGELIQRRNQPETVRIYLERVREVVWNRKFIKCGKIGTGNEQGDDAWGLGPADTQAGDLACILYGCSVPVILRHVPETNHQFTLIGESYLHGFMEGEVLTGRDKRKWDFDDEQFELH